MAYGPISASAPGKLMLLGEHAVVHGKHCLVCAINQRISVRLAPRSDGRVRIHSALGQFESCLEQLCVQSPFQFVLASLCHFKAEINTGFDISIDSAFSDRVGLGSSATITVAMTAAISKFLSKSIERKVLFDRSYEIVRDVQGTGSGADVAASVFGGALVYRTRPLEIRKIELSVPLTVVYSGSKTPTTTVIKQVTELQERFPGLVPSIFELMDRCSLEAEIAVNNQDWRRFGELLNFNQGLMEAVGVSSRKLAEIVYGLRADSGIYGAKISGSGLGDCVVGAGQLSTAEMDYEVLPLDIDNEGVIIK